MTNPKLDLSRGFAGNAGRGLPAVLRSALVAVYELHSRDRPADAGRVARLLGISPSEAARALLALDDRGLLWAERCRLTMAGLSVAARLSAARASRSRAA